MNISFFKKLNKDNKGMSLVEVLVAIVILSVAIAPIIYTFVYTTKFNAKAKIKQRAISAASTVMENMKAYDLEKVYEMFSVDDDGNPVSPSSFLQSNPTATYSNSLVSADTYLGTYWINSMSFSDSSETRTYDVSIQVNEGRKETIIEIPIFDINTDALFEENDKDLGSLYYDPYYVATEIVDTLGINHSLVQKVVIARNTTINMAASSVSFVYSYHYTVKYDDPDLPGVESATGDFTKTPHSNESKAITGDLRNIYFYYYPAYPDTYAYYDYSNADDPTSYTVQIESDNLFIDNRSGVDGVNLYVFKQRDTLKTYYDIITSENSYKLNVAPVDAAKDVPTTYNITNIFDCVQKNLGNDTPLSSVIYKSEFLPEASKYLVVAKDKKGSEKDVDLTAGIIVSVYDHVDDPDNRGDALVVLNGSVVR